MSYTFLLNYSMEASPFWDANQFPAIQEIPLIFFNPKIITEFTNNSHLFVSWATGFNSMPHIPFREDPS